ncbi:MGDG synthase family glycosyltransferase [Paenibacillus residui]|uniref:Glycosyltransferase n=1 Tax=Paenibacillus residui TaxID=629724 RepID=A0ABW3D765_9BACL
MYGLKALILYASYGDGHLQAARALQETLSRRGFKAVKLVDLYGESYPFLDRAVQQFYKMSSQYFPYIYGWIYRCTQNMKPQRMLNKGLKAWGAKKLMQLISREKPDVLICTFPMPAIRGRSGANIPTFTILTDFALHNRWIYSEYDLLFVATPDLKKSILEQGIDPGRVAVSGIPIRSSFPSVHLREQTVSDRDPAAARTFLRVLVMAGANGILRNLSEVISLIRRELKDARIAVVCGRNRALFNSIAKNFGNDPNVEIYGFVEQMAELMASSACIVTKAGGITLTEALASRLPIIVYRPLPGQEADNALYLQSQGVAAIARCPRELVKQIGMMTSLDRSERERMEAKMKMLTGESLDEHMKALWNASDSDRFNFTYDRFAGCGGASDKITNRILKELTSSLNLKTN